MSDYQESGWVRLHRKSFNTLVWKNAEWWRIWCWCLLRANHAPAKVLIHGREYSLEPGQFIMSYRRATGMYLECSTQVLRTCLKYLKRAKMITHTSDRNCSIITIINWSKYQTDNTPTNTLLTHCQHTTNTLLTTNKNDKNDKNEKEEDIAPSEPPSPPALIPEVVSKANGVPKKQAPQFDPTGKTRYLDWVYLSDAQLERVKAYYKAKGLGVEDFEEAVRALDRWFSNNPKKRLKRTDDAKALMGWPLDEALARRKNLLAIHAAEQRALGFQNQQRR